jgi:type IV pilus assembly protein PilY1
MVGNGVGNAVRALLIASLVTVGSSASLKADDTEIYQASYSPGGAGGRPNVLIIFDDSGSMNTNVLLQPPAYDPDADYYPIPASSSTDTMVYWAAYDPASDDVPVPPAYDTSNYFPVDINRCAESYDPLEDVGVFTSKALGWQSGTGSWANLTTAGAGTDHVDCLVDVVNANQSNGTGTGSPGNGYPKIPIGVYTTDEEYSASTPEDSDLEWANGKVYTFYSAHYMGYLEYIKNSAVSVTRTRLNIAQEAVKTIIASNPGIDFGLALFNSNVPDNLTFNFSTFRWTGTDVQARSGGRIAKRILESDDASARDAHREAIGVTVDGITSNGWTPLCESTYEAYRYLAGDSLYYGDQLDTAVDTPARDPAAEDPAGTYDSPATDCAYTYVILMTDGLPTFDTSANALVKALPGVTTCNSYQDDNGGTTENCLPELTKYMATQDLDADDSNGEQLSITSTIGFTTDQTLLSDAANNGGGKYFVANNAAGLAAALQGAVAIALSRDVSFTSPSVAVDSFTRTQSRDDVFFSMFNPQRRIDWPGNIKKLKLLLDSTICAPSDVCLVGEGNALAIGSQGEIKGSISTAWSSGDGGNVEAGGVGALLAARDLTGRTILTNTVTANVSGLEDFNSTNLDAAGYGYADDADLFAKFGVADQAELNAIINWGRGYDALDADQDADVTETRPWILADMLHSKPLVVNYGALGSSTVTDPDLRIVAGTNAGFLHMFGNSDGEEDWAFFPKELASVLTRRAENAVSDDHVYGIDGSPVLYSRDVNFDGTIDFLNDGDVAWIYFGLRRGGNAIYALDISNPDSPAFKWKIDQTTTGFGELGQTWSDPVVTRIPGHVDSDGVPKPVIIFGAGYDAANKDGPGIATDDNVGRGLYIVDAELGTLLWSVTPREKGELAATNLQETTLEHSVAGIVTPLDSNGDELTDRIYFADTGGNIWRVDMPGNCLPSDSNCQSDDPPPPPWSIVKLADMNNATSANPEDDRRFFNAPDVVRTSYADTVFDAVLIGSGDRTNPNATDVDNQFYMIRDEQVSPYFTVRPTQAACDDTVDPIDDFRCDLPLVPSDLYDATSNLIQSTDTTVSGQAAVDLAAARGWRIDLQDDGEKSLSRSLTIAGKTYFGTFAPADGLADMCEPDEGTGRLYVVNLLDAGANFDFDNDSDFERSWAIGSLIPDTPSPHFGEDGVIRLLLPPGSGGGGNMSNPFLTGASLPDPYGEYWYREEY